MTKHVFYCILTTLQLTPLNFNSLSHNVCAVSMFANGPMRRRYWRAVFDSAPRSPTPCSSTAKNTMSLYGVNKPWPSSPLNFANSVAQYSSSAFTDVSDFSSTATPTWLLEISGIFVCGKYAPAVFLCCGNILTTLPDDCSIDCGVPYPAGI